MKETRQLAGFVSRLHYEDLPKAVIRKAKALILDQLGCQLAGSVLPWSKKIDWGYFIPYMITGTLNQHPRTAIAQMESENKDRVTDFYDQATSLPT